MRTLLLILITVLLGCKTAHPLAGKNSILIKSNATTPMVVTDTTEYLKSEFVNNKAKYIGKPLENLLKDLKLEVKGYIYVITHMTKVNGVSLFFYPQMEFGAMNDHTNIKVLNIDLAEISIDQPHKLRIKNNHYWTQEERDFYGKQIVTDFGIPGYYGPKK